MYYDSAATQYLYRKDVFQTVADLAGVEHVLFGSDIPHRTAPSVDHARSAEWMRAVCPPFWEARGQSACGGSARWLNP